MNTHTTTERTDGFEVPVTRATPDTRLLLLDYELRSSWWAQWMGTAALQSISASYFAWKVNRKFRRWQRSVALARLVKARRRNQEKP